MTSSWPHLQQHDSFVPAQPPSEMVEQLKDDSRPITIHLPHKLPKDRPFANIIEVRHTTAAPQHLQRIMDMKGTNPADKSARLKTALRRDNQMLLAYCILLAGESLALEERSHEVNPLTQLHASIQPWDRSPSGN